MEHTYLIGQPGTGKHTLLKNHTLEAIYDGRGVLFLDPHGDDAIDILRHVPFNRRQDVIWFDLSDTDHPIALNPLAIAKPIAPAIAALLQAIKDGAGYGSTSTPTMSLYVQMSVAALIEAHEPLLGLPFMLTAPTYRTKVLKRVTDPLVRRFWDQFETLTTREKNQQIASTYNKAVSLFLDHRVRHVFGQRKSSFSVGDVLEGKILLLRLPIGELGIETVRSVGFLLLSEFYLAALRHPVPNPVEVFIGQADLYDGVTLSSMLTQLASRNVGITLVNENLDQLSPRMRGIILATTKRKYVFRLSMADTKLINEKMGPDNVNIELFKLEPYQARLFDGMHMTNELIEPFDWPMDKRVPRMIFSNMRRNYARPVDLVAAEVNALIENA